MFVCPVFCWLSRTGGVTETPRGIRFNVQNVAPSSSSCRAKTEEDLKESWGTIGKLEAFSGLLPNTIMTFDKQNMLARAVHLAFYDHRPLRLSPDVIWITIAQGFANHVNQNAEKLRSKFVSFEGKKTIAIQRNNFVKGNPNNDWYGVFPEFCDKIQEYIGEKTRMMLEANFSTTGLVERTVSQIVLMDTVKSYFEYETICGCGIPSIELTGKPEDWTSIRTRVAAFRNFDLEWWIDALIPILEEFEKASKGSPRIEFWTSICTLHGASGFRQPITGWIQSFFPYILVGQGSTMKRNTYLTEYLESIKNKAQNQLEAGVLTGGGCGTGVDLELIPSGISKVPFIFKDSKEGKQYNMIFCGGITCCILDSHNTVEPKIGWAILEAKSSSTSAEPSVYLYEVRKIYDVYEYKFSISNTARFVTQGEFLEGLSNGDENLLDSLCESLLVKYREIGCFMWECNAIKFSTMFSTVFEFVVMKSNELKGVAEDASYFKSYFEREDLPRNEYACSFTNLSGDATLVVPLPDKDSAPNKDFSSIGTFISTASRAQKIGFWTLVGRVMFDALRNSPSTTLWLSTSGLGVHYLHVRLDTKPKYYNHAKYKDAV